MCKMVSNTINSILGAAHIFYKWFKHLETSDSFKNPIEHIISFIFINFCNLQTPKHVPIRFAQPSWIFLVFLIFHSVIVLHVLGWLSPRASTIVSQARTTIKLLNNYLILF
ncbi:hypothetical protein Hdeb2414_s0003g00084781 [Helianthus debilis subsp. tardiflorus]